MSWIRFILWLGGIYTAYYLTLIAWEILRGKQGRVDDKTNELSFLEEANEVTLVPELSGADIVPPIYASGGVTLKNMFNLCRDEAVEYIKQVSF
jgi:hypothetical protein